MLLPFFTASCEAYYRRRVKHFAATARLNGPVTISNPSGCEIGEHVRIGAGCFFSCTGGLSIGANTQISRGVIIYTANHDYEGEALPYDDQYTKEPVSIGRSVWIGHGVCITPGVKIGEGAIVGLGTVVSKDVPMGAILVGQSQRIVKRRDMRRFQELEQAGALFGKKWPAA